jgi:hypothetical protein
MSPTPVTPPPAVTPVTPPPSPVDAITVLRKLDHLITVLEQRGALAPADVHHLRQTP